MRKDVVTLTVISDIPWVGKREIAEAITLDLNARGMILEQLFIEEVPGWETAPVTTSKP